MPDVVLNPALGLLEQSSKQVYDVNSTFDVTAGGYLMVSAVYHIAHDSAKPLIDSKVYAFGKFKN